MRTVWVVIENVMQGRFGTPMLTAVDKVCSTSPSNKAGMHTAMIVHRNE